MSKKDTPDDMIGFKDFINSEEKKNTPQNRRLDNLNYQLASFLEKDAKRLAKFITLFEEKSFMLKHYPQDSQIIAKLEGDIIENRIAITDHLSKKPNGLHKNLNEILGDHFSSL